MGASSNPLKNNSSCDKIILFSKPRSQSFKIVFIFLPIYSSLVFPYSLSSPIKQPYSAILVKKYFLLKVLTFRVMTPFTSQITPFKKYCCSYTGSINIGITDNIKNYCFHNTHFLFLYTSETSSDNFTACCYNNKRCRIDFLYSTSQFYRFNSLANRVHHSFFFFCILSYN